MCAFKSPFYDEDFKKLSEMVTTKEHPPLPDQYSDDLKHLYNQLMIKDPEQRPRINEILMLSILNQRAQKLLKELYNVEFEHTTIQGFNFKEAYKKMKEVEEGLKAIAEAQEDTFEEFAADAE